MIIEPNYRGFFWDIYNYYDKNINNISNFNFEDIYICTNMKDGLSQVKIDYCSEYPLGATILPISHLKNMIVLIQVTNNYDYEDVRRLIHELTHVYDFINYAKFFTNGIIQNFRGQPLFRSYELFSEFCAFGCDEIYAYKYQDMILGNNDLKKEMNDQDKLLENYMLKKRNKLLSKSFTDYDLFQVLGKIYAFDNYNQICDYSKSLVHKYIPILFKTTNTEYIYELYKVCFLSINNNSIFSNNIEKINSLLNSLCIRL